MHHLLQICLVNVMSRFSFFNTGWHTPHSRNGDVLWLPVSPSSDWGPCSTKGRSHRWHGHDRWLAGHDSLSPQTLTSPSQLNGGMSKQLLEELRNVKDVA